MLNLSDNNINNVNAEEILTHYVKQNVFIEKVVLKGNKSLHFTIAENINTETRKNILIQEHILPKLPLAANTGYVRCGDVPETCLNKYDVRYLALV